MQRAPALRVCLRVSVCCIDKDLLQFCVVSCVLIAACEFCRTGLRGLAFVFCKTKPCPRSPQFRDAHNATQAIETLSFDYRYAPQRVEPPAQPRAIPRQAKISPVFLSFV
jgi:hypothetical protein